MINLDHQYSKKFLDDYAADIFRQIESSSLGELKKNLENENSKIKDRIEEVLTRNYIHEILVSTPESLSNHIANFFEKVPEVIECYAPDLFFKEISLPSFRYKEHDFRAEVPSQEFDEAVNEYIASLKGIKKDSKIIEFYIDKFKKLKKQSESKIILAELESIKSGSIKKQEIFPEWVRKISKVFSYSHINKELAYKIVENVGAEYCPYCNESELHYKKTDCDKERDYRPSLDHFYPKAKYPFLAVSIYNLVPSCQFCNETRKGTTDTYIHEHAIPFLYGLGKEPLFLFDSNLAKIKYDQINNSDISIKLTKQQIKIENNLTLFDINYRYNQNHYKRRFIAYVKTKQMIADSNFNSEIQKILESALSFDLTQGLHPKKVKNKKFELDLYNQVLDHNIGFYE